MPSLHPWLASGPDITPGASATERGAPALPAEWLFAASREPVVVVNALSGTIIHANPAAALMVRIGCGELLGMKFVALFEGGSAREVLRGLAEAENLGQSSGLSLRTAFGKELAAGLSLVRVPPESFVLVRLSEVSAVGSTGEVGIPTSAVFAAIEAAPIAFLVTEAGLKIDYANRAFLKLIGAESPDEVAGRCLLQWLQLNAADLARLTEGLSQRQAAGTISSVIQSAYGPARQVEVCAVPVPDGVNTRWGFTVRILPRLN